MWIGASVQFAPPQRSSVKTLVSYAAGRRITWQSTRDMVGPLGSASVCSSCKDCHTVMSKYLAYREIVFRDRQLLLDSLADLGFSNVEVGEDLPLYGYQGDRRSEAAALVVRRQHIGSGSNDLGFAKSEGGYFPII